MDEFLFNCTLLSSSSFSTSVDFPCTQHMHLSFFFLAFVDMQCQQQQQLQFRCIRVIKSYFACRIRILKTELNNSAKRISGLIDWVELQSSDSPWLKLLRYCCLFLCNLWELFLNLCKCREWLKSLNMVLDWSIYNITCLISDIKPFLEQFQYKYPRIFVFLYWAWKYCFYSLANRIIISMFFNFCVAYFQEGPSKSVHILILLNNLFLNHSNAAKFSEINWALILIIFTKNKLF